MGYRAVSTLRVAIRSQYFLNAGRINGNRRFAIDRALILADSTACALLFLNDGTFLLITADRLVGTLLVADQADFVRVPGDASCLIDMCDPHLDEAFFFYGQRSDGSRGADPTTEIAEFFAVADPGHESGRVETGKPCFQESRLKGIVRTDFQALTTSRTHGHKFVLRQGSGRSNQTVVFQRAFRLQRIGFDDKR